MNSHEKISKGSLGGLLISLGIIYGDIGTSPLYVIKAIIGESIITADLIYGGISSIFWTLTLMTTVKYVTLALNADNNGEGGIFSLLNLTKKNAPWLMLPAIIGAVALLADGIITPPISVSSAVEGLRIFWPHIPTIPIVLAILTGIFLFQRFGTVVVGKSFGPLMFIWFLMLGFLGVLQILSRPEILNALNPYYAYNLLFHHPHGFWLLGAIFLCTTGAEALYSDLGHCGKQNIRLSWIFVKTCLVLNYLGQGAWLLQQQGEKLNGNPFYLIMPENFLIIGIIIATVAAVIASQALITGSFTLISEAISLNLWPKVRLFYPSERKGQLYVPSVNFLLWFGCVGVVLYFKESHAMEGAYGLSITLAMIMTTILLTSYLRKKNFSPILIAIFLIIFLPIELSFLYANMAKFFEGGYVTLIIGTMLGIVMAVWLYATRIKGRLSNYVPLKDYIHELKELSVDTSVAKLATNLVFLSSCPDPEEIDSKIIHSIFYKQPKRADIYWFVHIVVTDAPYTMEYKVDILAPEDVVRITFFLGFRVEQRVDYFVRFVVQEMVKNKEIDITSRYHSLKNKNIAGDFHFIILECYLSCENELTNLEAFILDTHYFIKDFTTSKDKWYGLDVSTVSIEKVPLLINPITDLVLRRVGHTS